MARLRLGVVLMVPPPLDREVDALRRAAGDGTYGRVPAHLTLVPPVNVNTSQLGEALGLLRAAAAATRPFSLSLGPPTTFLPHNPVLYLPVEDGDAPVVALRERVFSPPLSRPLTWPFVPHVTVADEASPERIAAAQLAMADYHVELSFDRVHLLEEGEGRIWRPVADAAFGPAAVVGRGGLALELSISQIVDPEALAFAAANGCEPDPAGRDNGAPGGVAVVARREGEIVGMLAGWASGTDANLARLVVSPGHRRQGIGSHLLAAFESWAAQAGCLRLLASGDEAEGPLAAIYSHGGWLEDKRLVKWSRDL